MKLMTELVFAAGIPCNPVAAAEDLRRAGYVVHERPGDPGDFFIEAVCIVDDTTIDDTTIDAARRQVENIIAPHGGDVVEWGPVDANYEPFAKLRERKLKVVGK